MIQKIISLTNYLKGLCHHNESDETIFETPSVEGNKYSHIKILIDNGHGENTYGKRSPYSANKVEPEIDFSVARFYIAEENRVYAERAYSNNNTSYVKATLSCVMFFVFYLVVVLLMPVILNVASSMM